MLWRLLLLLQVDAKLSEELLREELSEQQAQLAAALRSALQEQQHQGAAVQAELKSKIGELQAAAKTLETHTDSKVRPITVRPSRFNYQAAAQVVCTRMDSECWHADAAHLVGREKDTALNIETESLLALAACLIVVHM